MGGRVLGLHVKINVIALFAVCFWLTFLGSVSYHTSLTSLSFPFPSPFFLPSLLLCDFPSCCNGNRCNLQRYAAKLLRQKQKVFHLNFAALLQCVLGPDRVRLPACNTLLVEGMFTTFGYLTEEI